MRNPFTRESFIPKGAIKISDKQSSAVAYLTERNGVLYAIAFAGKADKPSWHYRFRNAQGRERCIVQHFERVRRHEQSRLDAAAKRKTFVHNVKAGDIYRTSWGYDQTNVEFFQIVEIKGKYAILREIAVASRDDGMGSERCVAQSGAFLEPTYKGDDRGVPIRRLIQDGSIKIDDVRRAWPWGHRGPGGIVIGDSFHRTAAGWGH